MEKRKYQQPAVDMHEPVQSEPMQVTLKECGGDTEKMIKRFLKVVKLDGVLQLSVKKSRFMKKSEAKKLKSIAAKRNLQKK